MRKFLFALALLPAMQAGAQTTAPVLKLGEATVTASLRSRTYVWDWFQPAGTYRNQYAYSGNILRLNFAIKAGSTDLDAEIAARFPLGLPDNSTAPRVSR